MFLGDRLPVVQRMILASTGRGRGAFAELLRVQASDFEEILEAMDGLPVTIRLLDPPLHEFLPSMEDLIVAETPGEVRRSRASNCSPPISWHEQNPMLGMRGVRLGIIKGGSTRCRCARHAGGGQAGRGRRPPDRRDHDPAHRHLAELALGVRRWVEEEVAAVLARSADGSMS